MPHPPHKVRTAIVLSGGGTRGAYEAGVVHYIRTMLPPHLAERFRFHIKCGSSVGAINAAFMAATTESHSFQGREILRLWQGIRSGDIYRRGPLPLGKLILRSLLGIASQVLGVRGFRRPDDSALQFQGLFDTQPFFHTLRQHCPWPSIQKNIQNGLIDAAVITATNMLTGRPELFLQKNPEVPHSERMETHLVRLSPRHVMASAALPILFPPVPIHDVFYSDGGLRLNTPIAPAVSLGAQRILVIGTRHDMTAGELDTLARIKVTKAPTLGQVLGKIFNAILLDRLDADRDQINRINRVLEACARNVPPETYQTICREAGVSQIEILSIFPGKDISSMVDDTVWGSYKKMQALGMLERFVFRLLETEPEYGSDLLSYFLFEPVYLKKLIDLGFEDARAQHHQLVEFAERTVEGAPPYSKSSVKSKN